MRDRAALRASVASSLRRRREILLVRGHGGGVGTVDAAPGGFDPIADLVLVGENVPAVLVPQVAIQSLEFGADSVSRFLEVGLSNLPIVGGGGADLGEPLDAGA
jgi:hypothetical protein